MPERRQSPLARVLPRHFSQAAGAPASNLGDREGFGHGAEAAARGVPRRRRSGLTGMV